MKGVATLAKFCPFLPTNCLLIRYLRTKLTCISNSLRSFFNAETYFTGLSDCHKLVLSVFKTTFSKTRPKEMMLEITKTLIKISSAKNFPQAYPQKQYLTIPVLKRIS